MGLGTFRRGIHPADDGKALTANEAIRSFRPTGEMVYPLNQHIGAPAQPVVAVGEQVLVGQTLAQPGGFMSTAICSAVSGTVKAIELRQTVSGKEALSIVVDNDGAYTPMPELGKPRDWKTLSAQAILEIIRDAGIVGQGGAAFPTHVKLSMKPGVQPEYVLINGAECEPYLTSDYRLMLEQTDSLFTGIEVLLHLFPEARCVIGVENNKPEAIGLLTERAASLDRVAVQALKTKYPQGGERMLIHALIGRDIHSKMLPIDAGCVVLNVSTTVAIARAVTQGIPQIATIMTVTGDAAATPCNVVVPVGTSHRELVELAGGFAAQPEKIVSGGPLMGVSMTSLDVPVMKASSSVLAMRVDEVAHWEATACMRCGRCVRACPERLVPPTMVHAADNEDWDEFQKVHGMECMECGCCTYVCPAKRRLTQTFRTAKAAVRAAAKK